MKNIFLSILTLTLFITAIHLSAQSNQLVHARVEAMMKEKLRNIDVQQLIDWVQNHPGTPLPEHLLPGSGGTVVSERNSDTVIGSNPEAESEVHAAINPADSNNIIVAAIVQDPTNFTAPLDIPVRYTKNFGQSWQTSSIQFNPNTGGLAFTAGGGDPVLAFEKTGKAWLSWLVLSLDFFNDPPVSLSLYASSSTNKGQTWSTPALIDKGEIAAEVLTGGVGSGELVDKQWMAVDQTSLPTAGNLYVSYTKFTIIDSVTSTAQILLKKKAANVNNFNAAPVQVHTNTYGIVQFSSIDVDDLGRVHVSFFAGNSGTDMGLYHAVSTDGGTSFSPEVKITSLWFPGLVEEAVTDSIPGIATDRLYPCPHIAAGKTPGALFVTWTGNGLPPALAAGFDVWVAKSTDNGATWSAPTAINPGSSATAQQYYSSIAVNEDGEICLSYYDRTDDPNGLLTDYVVAYSFDEGNTFTAANKVTSSPTDFEVVGDLNGEFGIGEYTQVVCTPNIAIPVWSDGRTNDGNIEIYAAFLPISSQISPITEWGAVTNLISVTAPNPNKGVVSLAVNVEQPTPITIRVFSADGRQVVVDQSKKTAVQGTRNFRFEVKPGVYFCQVETDFGTVVKKVVVE